MADGNGVPGVAIGIALAGGVLVWSALRNQTVSDTLRGLVRGESVPQRAPSGTQTMGSDPAGPGDPSLGTGGSDQGRAVAETAAGYLGVPYRWAGHTPEGWDCSGFVTYVLTQNGIKLPSSVHTFAIQFYSWSGAVTVGRDQCQPGDLVCWPSHVGIALDQQRMVNAPHAGAVTRVEKIWAGPAPVIRRPKAYYSEAAAPKPGG